MPIFFSRGSVDLLISLDSGENFDIYVPLTITDAPAAVVTSLDTADYMEMDSQSITLSWNPDSIENNEVDIQIFAYSNGDNVRHSAVKHVVDVFTGENTGKAVVSWDSVNNNKLQNSDLGIIFRVRPAANGNTGQFFTNDFSKNAPIFSKPIVRY